MSGEADREAIRQLYRRLIEKRDKRIDGDEDIGRDIENSRNFQENYCCSDSFYLEQIDMVKQSLPDNIISGTVGSYLYACFLPELAVEIGCTPDCIKGLKNPNLEGCNIASYEKRGGNVKKLNDVRSEEADVFIASGEKIDREDRNILRQDGVKVITLYNQDGDTINYILGESINLDQPEPPTPSPSPSPLPSPPTTDQTAWGWVWIVIIILIITALAAVFLR